MTNPASPLDTNRLAWNERAAIHLQGHPTYPVADFIANKAGLTPNTPDNLLPVQNKSLLHLQCHFGMDTLMWARNGARVTGVDFSPVAIAAANDLAAKINLPATFLESTIDNLPAHQHAPPPASFDIILNYFGVLCWLPDLAPWARTIAHFLKPGGYVYIADSHPVITTYDILPGQSQPTQFIPYFHRETIRYDSQGGTYAAPNAPTSHRTTYEWQHTLADIISALAIAGLRLDYLHEFPFAFYNLFYSNAPDIMHQTPDQFWHFNENPNRLPLMFSLKATKP